MLKDFISYGRLQDVVYMFALPFYPRRFYIKKKKVRHIAYDVRFVS